MNERARNLKLILKSIIADKEECKEFEKIKTIPEAYDKCKAKGYKGGMEEFVSDLMSLELLPQEIVKKLEEELNEVAGGKLDAKKGIASILSGLTVMSSGGVNINATQVAPKKATVSSKKNSLINKLDKKAASIGTSLLTAGAVGGYILRGLINSNSDYIKFMKEIESFRVTNKTNNVNLMYVISNLSSIANRLNNNEVLNTIFKKSDTTNNNDKRPLSLSFINNFCPKEFESFFFNLK